MPNSNYQFRAVPLDMIQYVTKKQKSSKHYFRYLLSRTMMMFDYKNLPETIPASVLERYLQLNGIATITRADDGNLYCFNGSYGGEQDVYYRPTKFIISNPHISQLTEDKTFSKECTIFGNEPHDAVLLRNDTEWEGLTPLIARYSVLMCENCITVRSASIMLRCLALLTANSDKGYKSALAYLSKLEAGELGVINDSRFSEGVTMQSPPSNNGSYLTQFIELQQYLKGSFFNELGLRANYNMKREAIGTGESTLDSDSILPLCDNMLKCRREDIAEVNNLFGTNISVDFSSAWLENRLESTANLVSQLMDAGLVKNEGDGLDQLDDVVNNGVNMGQEGGSSNDTGIFENSDGSDCRHSEGAGQGDGFVREKSENTGRNVVASESSCEDDKNGGSGENIGSSSEGIEKEEDKVDEVKDEVKDELENNELTVVEGLVEVVNDKVSQLIADARKGDLDE